MTDKEIEEINAAVRIVNPPLPKVDEFVEAVIDEFNRLAVDPNEKSST